MAVTFGFFDSVNGDRTYNADQMSQYFDGLISNGVYANLGNSLAVTASGTDMLVSIGTGRAIINCKWLRNDSTMPLAITQAHATLPRYTAVIVKLDETNRLMTITTKDGTPAATPSQPTIDTTTELCLAMILVPAGSTQVIQSRVTDMRGTSKCLYVTGLITQLNTDNLFYQFSSAFNEWFSVLSGHLSVNTFIKRFSKTVTLSTGSSTAIPLDMTNYTYHEEDIILVYVNGLRAIPGVDYTLDTSGSTPTVTPTATAVGTKVYIEVLKSVIGWNILADSNGNAIVTDQNDSILVN